MDLYNLLASSSNDFLSAFEIDIPPSEILEG